jgi:hypothetical protein
MKCHFKWENKWHSFPKSTTAMEIYDLAISLVPEMPFAPETTAWA